MNIKPIRTEADYNSAMAEVALIFGAEVGTDDFDRMDVMATLIESYESTHYPIEPPDPIAAIEYEIEKRGLNRNDLEPILGSSGRISEILNRKRRLTSTMMRNLHDCLGIPGDILLQTYPLEKSKKRKLSAEHISI